MSYIVGLTGGIGSGKSTIVRLFEKYPIPIIDADIIAREVVAKGSSLLDQIVEKFGSQVLLENGELDRGVLRQIIFNHKENTDWLNNLLHPAIRNEMLQQLEQTNAPYVLWVVPLLIENDLTKYCNRILVVDVLPEIQLERASKRDSNKVELIKNIMKSQVSREKRLSFADDVIENNLKLSDNIKNLEQQVDKLHHLYLSLVLQLKE